MKKWIVGLVALMTLCASSFGQETGMPPVPSEMKEAAKMAGEWTADLNMYSPGSTEAIKSKGSFTADVILGGRFVRQSHTYDMGQMGKMSGMQLITYDADAKVWRAWWFDEMTARALEFEGKMEGNKAVLVSKPMEMPGMPGKYTFRSTMTMVSPTKQTFLLEMNSGSSWQKLIEGEYTKK